MKTPSRPPSALTCLTAAVLFLMAISILWAVFLRHPLLVSQAPVRPPVTGLKPPVAVAPSVTPMAVNAGVPLGGGTNFVERPFPVALANHGMQWTSADGMDTNVIAKLAHNALEYDRMMAENAHIYRRQLVYLEETVAAVFEAAKLGGPPVRELTLPGADGQELQFEIVNSDSSGSSRQGAFSGHLAGDPGSQVSLAFMDGREAYTVLSPKDNIFVVAEPREPGQVIVKVIDPTTYGAGPASDVEDFIKTSSTRK